ncbi:hypothetical protein F5Y03DRAFT_151627 [Xylaria venustula]|nr:hypothetical protein F5Y03DRAFT_151627 [Xylaria venustula]
MTDDPLPATLSFLTDAAHLVLSVSSETSAHLMSRRNLLMFNNELHQSDVQRQHVCGCCGHIMIAGRGDVLKWDSSKTCHNTKKRRGRKEKTAAVAPKSGCRKTWTCRMCGRYTTIDLPSPPSRTPLRRFRQTTKSISSTTSSSAGITALSSKSTDTPIAESTKVSANASSKKRAKNRKQGLQALLQQSSSSKPQSGLGLSLADFMQK